jgi:DNA-binding LacI/PurR family transcriptional regulator
VARESGVSISTVSRVFTMPGLVSEPTRDRVAAVATRLGYHPNRAARGLITGKTGNLGVIVPDLGNPFFQAVLRGAQTRARETDHWVFLADSEEDPRAEHELIVQLAKQVDGIILCASRMTAPQLEEMAAHTRLVLVNRRAAGAPWVLMDYAGATQQAVDHLIALGHRRIGYLNGPQGSWSNRERRRVLRSAARKNRFELAEFGPLVPSFAAGVHAAELAHAAGVTAIVAYNDLMAIGVLSRFNDRGIPVPGQVSVVGFDDIEMAAMASPALTTAAMPKREAGRAAVDLLLGLLASDGGGAPGTPATPVTPGASATPGKYSADGIELAGQLIVRASTAMEGGGQP